MKCKPSAQGVKAGQAETHSPRSHESAGRIPATGCMYICSELLLAGDEEMITLEGWSPGIMTISLGACQSISTPCFSIHACAQGRGLPTIPFEACCTLQKHVKLLANNRFICPPFQPSPV
jgi:hypothetical protein